MSPRLSERIARKGSPVAASPFLHHFCTISGAVPFQRSCLRTTYFRVPVTILSRDMSRGETPKMSSPHKTLHCLFPFWGPIGPVDERPDSLRAPLLFQIRVHSRLFAVKHRRPPPRLNPDKIAYTHLNIFPAPVEAPWSGSPACRAVAPSEGGWSCSPVVLWSRCPALLAEIPANPPETVRDSQRWPPPPVEIARGADTPQPGLSRAASTYPDLARPKTDFPQAPGSFPPD